jgi:RNA-directed DNA polymerase
MHYAFDKWLDKNYPENPFERYADDAVIHCRNQEKAQELLERLKLRMQECFLEIHPEKTKIIYCQKAERKDGQENISFDFLGYTFRPREARSGTGERFLSFLPAISRKAEKKIKNEIRSWKLPRRTGMTIEQITIKINPQIRGWINYYGKFYRSALYSLVDYIEYKLCLWAKNKYKKFKGSLEGARKWLRKIQKELSTQS